VNGAVCLMRGKKLVDGDTVQVAGQPDIYTVRVHDAV
jgi:ribosome-associated protein YbcJ (S4-like RNA binding protein)